ncbi:MAG: MMPL family transporter [Elusimicrobia bacterium]|jgi:predicted RND superfamily exporter protein|nr:MMPL family transporter [Elusimicrobiota bacterium]
MVTVNNQETPEKSTGFAADRHFSFQRRASLFMAHLLMRKTGWILVAAILLVAFFTSFLPQLTFSTSADQFVLDKDVAVEFHERFKESFPKNDFFVIAYTRDDLFTSNRLNELKTLTEEIRTLDGVEDVVSLANVTDMKGTEDSFESDAFLIEVPVDQTRLSQLRNRALTNPLYQKNLLSDDGRTTAIIVYVHKTNSISEQTSQKPLIQNVQQILKPYQELGYQFYYAGRPTTDYYLAHYMNFDVKIFFPVSVILAIGAIYFLFRNIRLLVLAGMGILTTLGATLGLAGLTNIPLNNASVAVIPLVVCLALSDIIHIYSSLDRRLLSHNSSPRNAMMQILNKLLFPCFLTSLTTAIGFFSFTFNRVPAIRSFGWLASAGMIFEFLVAFGIVAPLLTYFRPDTIYRDPVTQTKREIPRLIHWFHHVATRRPLWVISLCLLAVGWGAMNSRHLKVETNLIEWFKKSSVVHQDILYIRNHLSGTDALDVSFQADQTGTFKNPDILIQIERIQKQIKALPAVDVCTGVTDLFKEMNKAFHEEDPSTYVLPSSRFLLEQYLLLYGRNDLGDYVTPGFDHTRLIVRANVPGSSQAALLIKDIETILKNNSLPGITSQITGRTKLDTATNAVLVSDQVVNITQTVMGIFLLMALVLQSWRLALLFLVPNLFPIIINFGIMGWAGIPLDSGTALIAASAFGILVDDTIHFFCAYRGAQEEGLPSARALEEVTNQKGEASLSSFSIISIAFGVLMFSHFSPIFFFGLLNVVILLVGLVGDHFLLKSIFALGFRKNGDQTGDNSSRQTRGKEPTVFRETVSKSYSEDIPKDISLKNHREITQETQPKHLDPVN